MNEKVPEYENENSRYALWERLRVRWHYLVLGAILGAASAGLAITIIPPSFQAVAVVQVAQVGQIGYAQLGQVMQVPSLAVEHVTTAIERMKTPAFQLAVAQVVGNLSWIKDLQRSAKVKTNYLSLQIIKATVPGTVPLIELKAYGSSPQDAKRMAEVSVSVLANRHADLAKPVIDKMRSDLTIAKEKLISAEKELDGINKQVTSASIKDDRFTQLSLMTGLRVQKESELFGQRQAIVALETALMAPATQMTRAIESVFVGNQPVAPRKTAALLLGLIVGLLAGMVAAIFVGARQGAKQVTT